MVLTVGSLFSGIGGIDLGLERAGMESRWFVEWDAHCQNVLRRHWPGVPVYGDITAVDWSSVEPVDVLAGGFPCQPVSIAGNRNAQADDRWLWPEFARAIREVRPCYVLVENVRNLLAVNGGSAFAEVIGSLATLGFDAEWDCIPAVAVGAPHRRDRLWIVAYPSELGRPKADSHDGRSLHTVRSRAGCRSACLRRGPTMADANRGRRESGRGGPSERGVPFPYSLRDGGRFDWWRTEPNVGRVADGIPHRVDRLRSLGNAVVPQVVEFIGRRIVAFDAGEAVAA